MNYREKARYGIEMINVKFKTVTDLKKKKKKKMKIFCRSRKTELTSAGM